MMWGRATGTTSAAPPRMRANSVPSAHGWGCYGYGPRWASDGNIGAKMCKPRLHPRTRVNSVLGWSRGFQVGMDYCVKPANTPKTLPILRADLATPQMPVTIVGTLFIRVRGGAGATPGRHHCIIPSPSLHHPITTIASSHHHHCTIPSPPLHHHLAIIASSPRHHCTITSSSLHHHLAIIAPSHRHHCIIASPSLHHRIAIIASLHHPIAIIVPLETTHPQSPRRTPAIPGTPVPYLRDILNFSSSDVILFMAQANHA
jgi:hypothetical protein